MITTEFRQKVRGAILEHRQNYPTMSDSKFAKTVGLNPSVFSRLKNGETERIASDIFWIEQGRKLGVSTRKKTWKIARTSVYEEIESNIKFCKEYQKAIIVVDECGIGKTCCSRHIIKNLENSFYIDCSQAPTKSLFIRHLAKTIGVDNVGRLHDVKENVKYYINMMDAPIIVLDDAGYLDPKVIVEIIELWNATEGNCGWMMMGDDSLEQKLKAGLSSKKVGYRALLSRFADDYVRVLPVTKQKRQQSLIQLIGDVAEANVENKKTIHKYIQLCIGKTRTLRHLETLIQLGKAI